jgi:hypothetical protein
MGDHKQSSGAAKGAVEAEAQAFGVECGKTLVEDGELGILQQRAGEEDAAALPVR